jgi:hypothetical protein
MIKKSYVLLILTVIRRCMILEQRTHLSKLYIAYQITVRVCFLKLQRALGAEVQHLKAVVSDHDRTLAVIESDVAELHQQQRRLASTVEQRSADLHRAAARVASIEVGQSIHAAAIRSMQQQLTVTSSMQQTQLKQLAEVEEQVTAAEQLVDMQHSTRLAAKKEELSSRTENTQLLEQKIKQLRSEINDRIQLTAQQQYIREMVQLLMISGSSPQQLELSGSQQQQQQQQQQLAPPEQLYIQ